MKPLSQAYILAAGLGKRMRPLTDDCPKPLLKVAGTAMIDSLQQKLLDAGVQEFIINAYYHAEKIQTHFADRADCQVLVESTRLETGGAVVNALQAGAISKTSGFWVANGDSLWWGDDGNTLKNMAAAWDESKMDGLLMLCPTERSFGYHGTGDFAVDSDGRLQRSMEGGQVFCGVQILNPAIFAGEKCEAFSLNRIYDKAITAGRLYGISHDGDWWHVGTPEDLQLCEKYMANGS